MEQCIYFETCNLADTENCNKNCIRYLEMNYLLESSNIPKSKWTHHKLRAEVCDVEAFQRLANIQKRIETFVEQNNFLYLYSTNCGNGKTTWTVKLMLQYFNEIWSGNGFRRRGLFINVPTFLTKCKDVISHPDEEFERLKQDIPNVDFVIFDDMVVNKMSNYDYSTLLNFTDQRIFNEKTTMFTGNIPLDSLSAYVGDRLASRILSGISIELKGVDRRNGCITDNQQGVSN